MTYLPTSYLLSLSAQGSPFIWNPFLPFSLPTLLLILSPCPPPPVPWLILPDSPAPPVSGRTQSFTSCIFSEGTESRTAAVCRELFCGPVGFTRKPPQHRQKDMKVCVCGVCVCECMCVCKPMWVRKCMHGWAHACVFSSVCSPDHLILEITSWKLCTDS